MDWHGNRSWSGQFHATNLVGLSVTKRAKMRVAIRLLTMSVVLGSAQPIHAQAFDCASAARAHQNALTAVNRAIQVYSACLGQGKTDCATQFGRLRRAQSDFADAMLARRRFCPI